MSATTFDFAETVIPERTPGPGRPAEINPFLDRVGSLVDGDGEPRDLAVTFVLPDGPDSEAAGRVKRQLARAGLVHNVSVFKRIEEIPEGSRVTFWAQSRIIPTRKPRDAASEGDAPAEGSADTGTATGSDGVTRLEP